jgi:hypothetical protein
MDEAGKLLADKTIEQRFTFSEFKPSLNLE